jgi:hypothetical protein
LNREYTDSSISNDSVINIVTEANPRNDIDTNIMHLEYESSSHAMLNNTIDKSNHSNLVYSKTLPKNTPVINFKNHISMKTLDAMVSAEEGLRNDISFQESHLEYETSSVATLDYMNEDDEVNKSNNDDVFRVPVKDLLDKIDRALISRRLLFSKVT